MHASTPVRPTTPADNDPEYYELQRDVALRLAAVSAPLFTTDADPERLWNMYLDAAPGGHRQHYQCAACHNFFRRCAHLATVDPETGYACSAVWGPSEVCEASGPFVRFAADAARLVEDARVTGVFLTEDKVLGNPLTVSKDAVPLSWTHLSGPNTRPHQKVPLKTAGQVAAERRQDFLILTQGLADYPKDLVAQAVRVLEAEAVTRAEHVKGVAKWLLALHASLEGAGRGTNRAHLIWLAAATAPPGFCHVRSTMISTLLDDLKAGLPFADVARKWANKMDPLQYQRPQAAPTEGQVARAEKVFAELGLAAALKRRYATLDDVRVKLWSPPAKKEEDKAAGRLFDHLRPRPAGAARVELPPKAVTFEKFRREVLPGALAVEVLAPSLGNYYGLLTAEDPAAPPIVQWDGLKRGDVELPRNPVTWYVYRGGSLASAWNLTAREWARVTAVFDAPYTWDVPEAFGHQDRKAFFALEGARETRPAQLCLFPEFLKGELREVRAVIEAHSNGARPSGAELGTANGVAFEKGSAALRVRVTTEGGSAVYDVDRWD